MKITDESMVGKRVRATIHYPRRGVFCPKIMWVYEGTVAHVRDIAADIRASGLYSDHEARAYQGEYHVTLRDVTSISDPETRTGIGLSSVVLLGHSDIWELLL